MGIFKRRKDEDIKIQLEREALDKLNSQEDDGYTLPFEIVPNDSIWNISGRTKAPHTLTAEELNNQAKNYKNGDENISDNNTVTEKIPMSSEQESTSPSEFLFQKMVQSRNKNTGDLTSDNEENQTKTKENITDLPNEEDLENPIEIDSQKSSDEEKNNAPKSEPLDIEAEINALKKIANLSVASSSNTQEVKTTESDNSKTPDLVEIPPEKEEKPEILNPLPSTQESVSPPSAKKENISTSSKNNIKSVSSAEERRTTLLARCNAYLEDDEFGTAKIGTDKYKLESVESILKGFET